MMKLHDIYDIAKYVLFEKKTTPFEEVQAYEKKRRTIEGYRALLKDYTKILDSVFLGYKNKYEFLIPDRWLSLSFVHLVEALKRYQASSLFNSLPSLTFNDYCNLEVNHEEMIKNYPSKRKEIMHYRGLIENLFYSVCKFEGSLTESFLNDIKSDEELIREHNKKRHLTLVVEEKPNIKFTAKKSVKRSIYDMLNDDRNNFVNKKRIISKLKISYDAFRSYIAQLRKDIIKQSLIDSLRIDNNKPSGYKLTDLK